MRTRILVLALVLLISGAAAQAQAPSTYQQPPADIVRMLDAPTLPQAQLSPDGRWLLLTQRPSLPSISDISAPMLRLAGARISPQVNGLFQNSWITNLTLVELSTNRSREISLPAGPRLAFITWSPDSKHIAFVQRGDRELELWVAEAATGKAAKVTGALNATTGSPYRWLPNSRQMVALLIPAGRAAEPQTSAVPVGPNVQESGGVRAPVRTYQDLLQSQHDVALFKHYFTAQLAVVEADRAGSTKIGSPAIFDEMSPSPDGRYIYVSRVVEPFSYFVPYSDFAQEAEIWDLNGRLIKKLASLSLAEKTPIGGVKTGPRSVRWHPNLPATLAYTEALDDGDPKKKVAHRDRLVMLEAPFTQEPREVLKSEYRFGGIDWTKNNDYAIWREFDRPTRKTRTHLADGKLTGQPSRLMFEYSTEDRYNSPGNLITDTNAAGQRVVLQSTDGKYLYLSGPGATPQGDRPFLRRLDLSTLKTDELFRSEDPYYESLVSILDADAKKIITSRESVSEAPNLVLRDLGQKTDKMLTNFTDPQPAFRKVKKQLITYRRSDGIQLSGTLYLPPDYKQGERRPTFIWAYPREFASADAASQISDSPNRFTKVGGASHLFLVMQGYVVLDNAAMPILGGDKANDTFVDQLTKNAEAAINHLAEMGVTDRERVGVGGHSYGAFMTANLLAHTDLFRTGIARSGAYNRTLTPFAFQNEQRSFWEASDVYMRMSPFMHANKIDEPILLIHGEADNNSGTFPIQSERFFHALKGLGKNARFVLLPREAHGYSARESVLHTIYEMVTWMDRHVKNAPPRNGQAGKQ